MSSKTTKTQKLDIRLTPEAKQKLYSAATLLQRSVSEFVLESALARAEETLADRKHFGLKAEQWTAFIEALDKEVMTLPRLQQLFDEPSVFEKREI
ncbi:MAG: DUF1778 domain-containing protein [Blastocatellia bacterium]|nr:DUF1778 domain-containing protein [Blastocatellia bacterium]MBN8724595.1 DUF1778 domain-containing protein [Acidobacteriota bacterium]